MAPLLARWGRTGIVLVTRDCLPWFKFRSNEWDILSRGWTLEQRGFILEVLNRMAQDERRGYLTVGGKPATIGQIAKMLTCHDEAASNYLTDALTVGLLESNGDGLRSTWIIADEQERARNSQNGKLGGRPKNRTETGSKPEVNRNQSGVKAAPSISNSSSDSSSIGGGIIDESPTGGDCAPSETPDHQPDDNEIHPSVLEAVKAFMGVRFVPRAVEFKLADCIALTSTQAVLDAFLWAAGQKPKPSMTAVLARAKTIEGGKGFAAGKSAGLSGNGDLW